MFIGRVRRRRARRWATRRAGRRFAWEPRRCGHADLFNDLLGGMFEHHVVPVEHETNCNGADLVIAIGRGAQPRRHIGRPVRVCWRLLAGSPRVEFLDRASVDPGRPAVVANNVRPFTGAFEQLKFDAWVDARYGNTTGIR